MIVISARLVENRESSSVVTPMVCVFGSRVVALNVLCQPLETLAVALSHDDTAHEDLIVVVSVLLQTSDFAHRLVRTSIGRTPSMA